MDSNTVSMAIGIILLLAFLVWQDRHREAVEAAKAWVVEWALVATAGVVGAAIALLCLYWLIGFVHWAWYN